MERRVAAAGKAHPELTGADVVATDAGVGAVLTHAAPLARSTSLVVGAGAYAAPGQFPLFGGLLSSIALGLDGAASPIPVAGSVDIVWSAPNAQPYSAGVQSLGAGRQQVVFGGGF